jgi:hypothetical protein
MPDGGMPTGGPARPGVEAGPPRATMPLQSCRRGSKCVCVGGGAPRAQRQQCRPIDAGKTRKTQRKGEKDTWGHPAVVSQPNQPTAPTTHHPQTAQMNTAAQGDGPAERQSQKHKRNTQGSSRLAESTQAAQAAATSSAAQDAKLSHLGATPPLTTPPGMPACIPMGAPMPPPTPPMPANTNRGGRRLCVWGGGEGEGWVDGSRRPCNVTDSSTPHGACMKGAQGHYHAGGGALRLHTAARAKDTHTSAHAGPSCTHTFGLARMQGTGRALARGNVPPRPTPTLVLPYAMRCMNDC